MLWLRSLSSLRKSTFFGALSHIRYFDAPPRKDPTYAEVNNSDIQYFQRFLGSNNVVLDAEALKPYNSDWMGKYHGHSKVALKPRTREHVSEILQYCNTRRLPVVPQGGNTGLVGGSVPVFSEVVLSLSGLNNIQSFDEVSGVLVCGAGCVLQTLDDYVKKHNWIMPLDLGAKGSCQIGGNVSTNAGGLRLLRYGSLHGTVLGVEVVLADGAVLDLLKTLRKDNTGYDLKQLFIGAEGTLGVVTSVAIQCAPKPASVQVAFLAASSWQQVLTLIQRARHNLGEVLSAFEFLDAASMDMVTHNLPGARNPLGDEDSRHPFYVLIETHGSNGAHDVAKMDAFLEEVMGEGVVVNGVVSQSEAQAAEIWRVREGVPESLSHEGYVYKYDVSMPVSVMYSLVEEVRGRLAHVKGAKVVGYGHVGDGNLHLNVTVPGGPSAEVAGSLEPWLWEWTAKQRGSISAEHGVGLMKADVLHYSKTSAAVDAMLALKKMFDPRFILNPYKVLPSTPRQS